MKVKHPALKIAYNGAGDLALRANRDFRAIVGQTKSPDGDGAMYELLEPFLDADGWEWIRPEEIGALTAAPILGRRDANGEVTEAYGFMDYALESLLGRLRRTGTAVLVNGQVEHGNA